MDYKLILEMVKSIKKIVSNNGFKVRKKGEADFVTEIDIEVQEYIIRELKTITPDIQIMAEEKENIDIDFSRPVWILDPIDGTTNLVHNFNHSAVSLALYNGKEIVFGVVYNPFSDELFMAELGKGCYLNNKRIKVSNSKKLKDSLIMVGTSSYDKDMVKGVFEDIIKVFKNSRDIRRSGAAALDLAYVACGRVDGFFERNLKPWDVAAGTILVKEAGGAVSNYIGSDITFENNCNIIASNKEIHQEIFAIIGGRDRD